MIQLLEGGKYLVNGAEIVEPEKAAAHPAWWKGRSA